MLQLGRALCGDLRVGDYARVGYHLRRLFGVAVDEINGLFICREGKL